MVEIQYLNGYFIIAVLYCLLYSIFAGETEKQIWYSSARNAIERRLDSAGIGLSCSDPCINTDSKTNHVAKNIVLVVGDGMGPSTLAAARILHGQRVNRNGEETDLVWDKFPALAMAKTYNVDAQIGDSSACATAISCGVKARYETLGLDASARFQDCFSSFDSMTPSILTWAQQQGKSTGIVTNTRITHATPAAFYAHSPSRYWEDDSRVPATSRRLCKDIARQLIEDEPGKKINVILGGGRRHFVSAVTFDTEQPTKEGRRLDGRNLITDWIRDKKKQSLASEYVSTRGELQRVNTSTTDYLLGLFSYSHMDFNADRDKSLVGDPSLAEMTKTALEILDKSAKGFFLFVEGGRIDHAHHYNNAYRALDETLELEATVNTILEFVDPKETLIIVTADHSHVLKFGGYGTVKGNPIFGFDSAVSDIDKLPYTTLLYTSGPGYNNPRTSKIPSKPHDIIQNAVAPRNWAAHGGEDVHVYALGPLDTVLFSGTIDQTYIPHAISYSSCLGMYAERCECMQKVCEPKVIKTEKNTVKNVTELCKDYKCDKDEELDNMISDEYVVGKHMYLISNKSDVCIHFNSIWIVIVYIVFFVYI